MYWKYVLKRIIIGLIIYVLIIFIYSVLFNVMFAVNNRYLLEGSVVSKIFSSWIDTLTFNYGQSNVIRSFKGETDVIKIVLERIPNTLLLFTSSIIIDIFWNMVRNKKAQKAGSLMDKTTSIITMICYGLPVWWVGLVMIMLLLSLFFISFKRYS